MKYFLNILRKIEIKCLFKFRKVYFVDIGSKYHENLASFLKNNRDSGDYVCFLLNNLLNSSAPHKSIYNNALLSFFGKIIAFYYRVLFPAHYLWGGGLTVDSNFRKLGLARHLIKIDEEFARKNNINTIKTAVASFNIPIFKKMGFSEAGLWHIFVFKLNQVKVADSGNFTIREAVDTDIVNLEKFLSESKYYNSCGRMYAEDLTWYPLDYLWLDDFIKKGKVLLSEDDFGIRSLAIINKKSLINPFPDDNLSIMEIGYFDEDWMPVLNFIRQNYHPDFIRIYSAAGIPSVGIKGQRKVQFNYLFGELWKMDFSGEELLFTPIIIMQKAF